MLFINLIYLERFFSLILKAKEVSISVSFPLWKMLFIAYIYIYAAFGLWEVFLNWLT